MSKTWIDVRICNEVLDIANMRIKDFDNVSKFIFFKLRKETFEETRKENADWTEEKDFYLQNHLFLNPLSVFETYISASIEDFEKLNISKRNKEYFEAIQEDYKTCRKKVYEHTTGIIRLSKSELAMIYNYIYTIFDKISFLISKVYKFKINEGKVEFTQDGLFNCKLSGNNMLFKEIKNDNIWPLYLIMKDVRKMSNLKNLQANTFNLKKIRNCTEHRSTVLVEAVNLEEAIFLLLKMARDAVLHTFALIHTCPKEYTHDKATTIGTTFHCASKQIVDKGIHEDLIIK